jgi:DUF3096 family protein
VRVVGSRSRRLVAGSDAGTSRRPGAAAAARCERRCSRVVAMRASSTQQSEHSMNLSLSIGPVVSLIAGILILIMPRLLNFIVAIYLILIGLIGLFGSGTIKLP